MATITLSIAESDNPEMMLVGWVFPAADLRHPVIGHSIVLKPTLNAQFDLPPGFYFYRFNMAASGKAKVAAEIPGAPTQSDDFDTKDGGPFHRSLNFEVGV